MAGSPRPIDPRGPRFNQGVLTVALLVGFALNLKAIAPVFAVVLFVGAAFGPRWGPFLRLYAEVIKPRLSPPKELEDPRPPRFAATIGTVFLAAATVAFIAGAGTLGWVLTLIVAALAGLAAITGICVGCEIYLMATRRRRAEVTA
jgi:peptidoglycan/LPS O-acetylase OafA/YrhL